MDRSYREVSYESWLSRIAGSLKSVLFGLLLALGALPLMWCNEGRAVRTARSLEEGRGAVVRVDAGAPAAANEGRLVHLTGKADTTERLSDPDFGVAMNALRLARKVEMYQWQEHEKEETRDKIGGGRETVRHYSYSEVWSEREIRSDSFRDSTGHRNPGPLPFTSETFLAQDARVGGFRLCRELVAKIPVAEPLRLSSAVASAPAPALQVRLAGDGYYRGRDPKTPQIGDVRVTYSVVRPQEVSVVARQQDGQLLPYPTRAGDALLMLAAGRQDPDAMFRSEERANAVLTWILRAVGFLLLLGGLLLVFRPLAVVASVVPVFGRLLGAGLFLFSLAVAAAVSLATIAAAWVFHRPLLGLALFALTVVALVLLHRLAARRRAAAAR